MSATRALLDTLLRVRRDAELRSLVSLASVHGTRRTLAEEIREATESIEAARASLGGALEGRIDADALRLGAQGAIMHELRRRRSIASLASTEPALARAQRMAADAAAKRMGVELLLQRRAAEARRRESRIEQAAMDEIAARHAGGWA